MVWLSALSARSVLAAVAATALAASILSAAPASAATDLSMVTTASDATFGPDGTHYPSDTPDIRSGFDGLTVVDVPASATAIRRALDALTAQQIDGGAVIRVAPGDIPAMTALNGYANTRQQKVLITARDGFESVTGSVGWRFTNVTGITVMRFDLAEIDVKGATHCSFAWLRLTNHYFGAAGSNGIPVHDVEFFEMVEPAAVVKSSDSAQIKAYAPESLTDVVIDGSYVAPSFYVDGDYGGENPRPHTDSLQIEGSGIGSSSVMIRDTAVFASNNSAMIIGGVPGVTFDHTLVVGGGAQALRYPFLAGGAGAAGALQGGGSQSAIQGSGGGNVTATDSVFIGSLQPVWSQVRNTLTDQKNKVAGAGAFTVDAALGALTIGALDAVSVPPTPEFLRHIWDVTASAQPEQPLPGNTPVDTPTAVPSETPAPSPAGPQPTTPGPAAAASTSSSSSTNTSTTAARADAARSASASAAAVTAGATSKPAKPMASAIKAAKARHVAAVRKNTRAITKVKKRIRTTKSAKVRAAERTHLAALRKKAAKIRREWARLVALYG